MRTKQMNKMKKKNNKKITSKKKKNKIQQIY